MFTTVQSISAPMVIAEIGVNHDGSFDRALELVRIAKTAQADAVKLQVFSAAELADQSTPMAAYQQEQMGQGNQFSMLRKLELSDEALIAVCQEARSLGLKTVATPFSLADVDRLKHLKLDAVKVASPDIINKPLLRKISSLSCPVILSTGAATEEEINLAVSFIKPSVPALAVLHCVSSYPTPDDQLHLGQIHRLKRFGIPVGYSDHSMRTDSGFMAVLAGASILERHLTYDTAAQGPDHAASSSPSQFAQYVTHVRQAQKFLGHTDVRSPFPLEEDVRRLSRQSLVTVADFPAGHVIKTDDLATRRPAGGETPWNVDLFRSRSLKRSIPAGHRISLADLTDE
jgi:sialic acid synthase SpsE